MPVIKEYESSKAKITVEELTGHRFITTYWDKSMSLEADRQVFEFETYGGALGKALDLSMEVLMDLSDWKEV
jgi:hypothetical protein